jgi:hypothetical protein
VTQLGFRGAGRHAELRGNLLVGEPLEVVQQQHRAVLIGQRRQRSLEIDLVANAHRPRRWLDALRERRLAAPPAAQHLVGDAHGDTDEPGAKRGLAAERA